MNKNIPKQMNAAVIDRFGGSEELHVASVSVPELSENEIPINVNVAEVGVWDPWLRGGGASNGNFPMVLGSDEAGSVADIRSRVSRFKIGDQV